MRFFFKTAFFLFAAAVSLIFCDRAFALNAENGIFQTDADGYTKFTGETKPEKFVNYYIDDTVKINKDESFCFPKTSVLRIKKGAELQIYVGGAADIRGTLIIEEGARVTVSGELKLREGARAECFGELVSTAKSTVVISGEFRSFSSSVVVFSGNTSLCKSGTYLNDGTTTFAKNANAVISGMFDVSKKGKLLIKGTFSTTLNAEVNIRGYILLTGKYYNTGELFLRKDATDMLGEGQFVTGTSGRVFDERKDEISDDENDAGGENEENYPKMLKGIDVSYWQGAIDWKKVKAAGIDFMIARASLGDYYVDETLDYNMTEAKRNGIKVGAYHFLQADTVEKARTEAKFFIEAIKPYKLDLPAIVDIEDTRHIKLSKEELTKIADVFCEELKKAGYEPMIYSSASWLNEKLNTKELSDYGIWVAHWGTVKPAFSGDYAVWQFSCKGIVSGISGDVDLNIAYKDSLSAYR